MPGGARWAVRAGEIGGRSGRDCCVCRMVSAGGFPITRTGAACAGLPAGVGGLIVCVVAAVSPALGFQCGPLPGVVLAGCGTVAVLVGFSLPDLWMISPAEHECSGQRGRRSGCVLLGMDAAGKQR